MRDTTLDRRRPPTPGEPRDLPFPGFDRTELSPGLEAWIAPLEDTRLVTVQLVTRGGGQLDPPDRPGLAGFTAGVLDQGTEESGAFEIASRSERLGASLSVAADWDTLTLSVQGLAKDLGALLELLAEIALRPTFPAPEVERSRGRRLTEILRRRTLPGAIASERFAAALYGDQPYGHPLIGTEDSVQAIGQGDLRSFYTAFVRTGGASLVAAGAIERQELLIRAGELFGEWTETPRPPDPPIQPPTRESVEKVAVDRPGASQTELRTGHAAVPRNHPDRTALVILSALLGGKFTSRLNLELREKHGLTYGVRTRFSGRRGPGPFQVSTAVATSGVGLAMETILRELRRLREEPVSDDELEDTKRYLIGVFPYTLQTADDVVQRLAQIPIHDLPEDYYDRYRERIEAVTVEEIQRVARQHLHPDRAVVVAVGPEEELVEQL